LKAGEKTAFPRLLWLLRRIRRNSGLKDCERAEVLQLERIGQRRKGGIRIERTGTWTMAYMYGICAAKGYNRL